MKKEPRKKHDHIADVDRKVAEANATAPPEDRSPLQKMADLTRRVVNVPKAEAEKAKRKRH